MGLFDFLFNRRQEKIFAPNWQPVGGSFAPHFYDAFNSKPEPTKLDLARAYTDTVYACSSLIANKIATTPVKLYCVTNPGQPRPKCRTRPLSQKTLSWLRHTKVYSPDVKIEEVVEHPILALLRKINAVHNYFELIGMTQLWLELTGNAYWLIKGDHFGIPVELYPLPSQSVTPVRNEDGFIVEWKVGSGMDALTYSTHEIIHFKFANPLDPYGEGTSPARAAWGRISISGKFLAYLDSTLSNGARPDAVLSPKDPISPIEAERLAKEFGHRFRGQGNGGVLVADQSMTLSPLTFPPRDLAELQLYQEIKTTVCNVYHVPPDIFELGESNRSTAEAALFSLAEHCIKPRMYTLLGKLNERLVPMFDQGQGRLFLEADNVVPADKAFELQEDQFLVSVGAVTRNEVREKYGYAPAAWGEEPLLPPGMLPMSATEEPDDNPDPTPTQPEDKPRAEYGPAIGNLQTSVYGGQLPREAAIAQVVILYGLTSEQAGALFPDVAPVNLTQQAGSQPGEGSQPGSLPGSQPADDVETELFGKTFKCGGEGGKPGPCPEGGADDTTGSGEAGKPAPGSHHEKLTQETDKLQDEVENDPEAKKTAVSVYQKVKAKLVGIAMDELPAWALDTADLYTFEMALNAQQAGTTLTAKAIAFAISKAYLGARKLVGKSYKDGTEPDLDKIAGQLLQLVTILAEAAGQEPPTLDEVKERLQEAKDRHADDNQDGKSVKKKSLPLPDIRQRYNYDCGAAAVLTVLQYFGVGPDNEEALISALGTNEEDGTSPAQIAGYLASCGLDISAENDLTIDDLAQLTGDGFPVICCVQDSDNPSDIAYERAGHWLVVAGVCPEGCVQVADPAEGPHEISGPDFLARWQDTDGEGQFIHFGIIVGKPVSSSPDGAGSDGMKGLRYKAGPRLKNPLPLAEALQKFFRKQGQAVLQKLKEAPALDTKALPLPGWFDIDQWSREMAEEMRPTVALYYDFGARETVARIGAAWDLLKVVQPQLRAGLNKATLLFCEDTNNTTSMELSAALSALRDQLAAGMEAGEAQNKLTQRVQEIFDSAETARAYRIAVTEASRGQHAAQEIVAKESGIVKGKRWILSDDACPLCLPLSGKVVDLGEPFTTLDGGGPYSVVQYPPLHPSCRCDMVEVVEGVND